MSEANFVRRRNVWLVLTIVAFLSPSFWIYVLVAAPLSYWAGKKDSNPLALYVLLLHVIPPLGIEIPTILISRIFDLTNFRLLSFTILIPIWLNERKLKTGNVRSMFLVDAGILVYMFLQLVLIWPYEEATNTLRRAFLFLTDAVLVYYVFSRYCKHKSVIMEVMAAFVMALVIVVPVAAFESSSSWLMYAGIAPAWGALDVASYVRRGDILRSQLSAGHSLTLGYLFAMAFGFWLCISKILPRSIIRFFSAIIWLGLLAALSRAPWLVAVFIFFAFVSLQPNGVKSALKILIISFPVVLAISFSPIGERVIDHLPFVGSVDDNNVEYRKKFAEAALERISENPVFGDPFYMYHLEDLRQGQGIIDPVNTYAAIAMLYGIVGLILYIIPMLLTTYKVGKVILQRPVKIDDDLHRLGIGLFVCMIGTMLFQATCSLIGAIPVLYYMLVGMSVAILALFKEKHSS